MDVIESAAKAAWELYGGSTWEEAPRERQKQTIAFVRAGLLAVAGADISKEMINAGWNDDADSDRFEENFRTTLREIAMCDHADYADDRGEPDCKRCNDSGWLPEIEGGDGSYVTSRPCKCDAGDRASRLS